MGGGPPNARFGAGNLGKCFLWDTAALYSFWHLTFWTVIWCACTWITLLADPDYQ